MDKEKRYTSFEAMQYLERKNPGVKVRPDTFYHRVIRKGIPYETQYINGQQQRMFCREDLDKVHFRASRSYVVRSTGETIYFDAVKPEPVHTTADIMRLSKKYGPLADEEELLRLIPHYTRGAIKQRRRRKTILIVGYNPYKRGVYWFPIDQIESLSFQPREQALQKSA